MGMKRLPYRRILMHALRKRCPRCGRGELFARWYTLHERCDACDLVFEASEGSTWAFMYVTTAAITGLIIVAMLLIHAGGNWVWRLLVLPVALVAITGTLPIRKSLAIALEYVMDIWFDRHETPPSDSPRNGSHRAAKEHE
jgi:uncharacterized protein (DUF983 family)